MSHSLQILLNGAKGRMGQAITAIASSENANVFAGLFMVTLIGLIVETLIFRRIEQLTVRRWGMQT